MDDTYTVAELSRVVARAVARAFPDEIWVEGEIRDLARSRNGHVYFSLVDPDDDGNGSASLPVTLFASDRDAVNRVLIRSGAVRMTDGVHVRIRGRVGHYAARATVQLRMTWIDTDFTVGKLAAERRALLLALEAGGHLQRNGELAIPPVPLHVGLVTSVGSAAHADFVTELGRTGYAFRVTIADARVQGATAPASIVAALHAVAGAGPDVVAVVRGGGAQTDLAAFDTEPVAMAIAGAPAPVFTGIGHEVDSTVADHVAAAAYKTPTACAQAIAGRVAAFEMRLADAALGLGAATDSAVRRSVRRLDALQGGLTSTGRLQLARHGDSLQRQMVAIGQRSGRAVTSAERRIDAITGRSRQAAHNAVLVRESRLGDLVRRLRTAIPRALTEQDRVVSGLDAVRRAHEPSRMLARGWSVTYGADGRLVRSPEDAAPGTRIRTHTAGGDITSTVEEDGGDMEVK